MASSPPRDPELLRLRRILKDLVLVLEDSEPWAQNILNQPAHGGQVDLDRMACSIRDALRLARSGTR